MAHRLEMLIIHTNPFVLITVQKREWSFIYREGRCLLIVQLMLKPIMPVIYIVPPMQYFQEKKQDASLVTSCCCYGPSVSFPEVSGWSETPN